MNELQNLESYPHKCGNLIFDRGGIANQWRIIKIFKKWS